MSRGAETLLDFWFGDDLDSPEGVGARMATWFQGGASFDDAIRARFAGWPDAAIAGELDEWRVTPRGMLALVLVLDQLPRNLHRDSPHAFAYDTRALEVARQAIAAGHVDLLHPIEAGFLLLPLEHAEDLACQEECIAAYARLRDDARPTLRPFLETSVDYAERHRVLIARFRRFPHRNAVLGRESTEEERRFLEAGGDTFG